MTELENHLLNGLRDLSAQFKEQHEASKATLITLETMYARTLKENGHLADQVKDLKSQVSSLIMQLNCLVNLYESSKT